MLDECPGPFQCQGLDACFTDIATILPAKLNNSDETLVYVSCMSSYTIRSYNPRTGEVRLVVGNGERGSHTEGLLEDPFGLAVDSKGRLIISSLEGYTILRYDPSQPEDKQLTCLAGRSGIRWFRDGACLFVLFSPLFCNSALIFSSLLCTGMGWCDSLCGDCAGVTIDPFDSIYFCDYAHGAIRAISPEGYVYTLVCADSVYCEVGFEFSAPFGIHFDALALERGEPCLYVLDFHRLIKIELDPASFPDPQVSSCFLVSTTHFLLVLTWRENHCSLSDFPAECVRHGSSSSAAISGTEPNPDRGRNQTHPVSIGCSRLPIWMQSSLDQ